MKARLSGYKENNIRNINWIKVDDINSVEKKVLSYLNNNLKLEIAKGLEYFHTTLNVVLDTILRVVNKEQEITENETKNNNNLEFYCKLCNVSFDSKQGLITHNNRSNNHKDKSPKCVYCKKVLSCIKSLKRHVKICKEKN